MTSTAVAQEQIDSVLRSAVEAREVPGVVALAASDKGAIYDGAFGVRDLNAGSAMTGDTVFRIAATEVIALVIDAMRNSASSFNGRASPMSASPNVP